MDLQMKSIYGIYHAWEDAKAAIEELHRFGFSDKDVSLLVHAETIQKDDLAPERHTQAAHGLAWGVTGGALLGGGLGLLAGLGSLVIPGIGPMIAFGPILSALTGASMGGAAGSIAGAFVGVGIPKHHWEELTDSLVDGGVLVSVHAENPDVRSTAYAILERNNAISVSTSEQNLITSMDDLRSHLNFAPAPSVSELDSRKSV